MIIIRNLLLAVSLLFIITPYVQATNEAEPIKGKIYTPGTQENFKHALATYDYIVIDFYADWCHYCGQMNKVIDALAQDSEMNEVLFMKINTDQHRDIAALYGVRSLPTTVLLVDGKHINTVYGLKDKKSLKKIIKETFSFKN